MIMKKYLSIFLIVIILLLSACSGSNSVKASNKAISCANEAIEIGEAYLSYDMTYEDAAKKLDELQDDMSYVTEDSNSEDEHHVADLGISIDIQSLSIALTNDNFNSSAATYDKVQEAVDELKADADNY